MPCAEHRFTPFCAPVEGIADAAVFAQGCGVVPVGKECIGNS